MTLLSSVTLAAVSGAFIFCNCAIASVYTSTFCSASLGSRTFSQSNSTSCQVNGTLGTSYYIVAANSYASFGVYGGIGEADIQTTLLDIRSLDTQLYSAAPAQVSQTFSSAGPERTGSITFLGQCINRKSIYVFSACSGGVTFIGRLGAVTFHTPSCSALLVCDQFSYPIQLGTPFSVSMLTQASMAHDGDTTVDQGFAFKLADSENRTVPIDLAPNTTAVPETSSLLLASLGLAATLLPITQSNRPSSL